MDVSSQLQDLATLSQKKSPGYPLDRQLCGPLSWSGCNGEEKVWIMLLRVNALTLIHGKLKNLEDCSENSMKVFSFVSCFGSIDVIDRKSVV